MAQQGGDPSHRGGGSREQPESGPRDDDGRSRQAQQGDGDGGDGQQSAYSRLGRQMGDHGSGSARDIGGDQTHRNSERRSDSGSSGGGGTDRGHAPGGYGSPMSGSSGRQLHWDAAYHPWRDGQLRNPDNDDDEWRRDRYRKFADEFDAWQRGRSGQAGAPDQGASDISTGSTPGKTE